MAEQGSPKRVSRTRVKADKTKVLVRHTQLDGTYIAKWPGGGEVPAALSGVWTDWRKLDTQIGVYNNAHA